MDKNTIKPKICLAFLAFLTLSFSQDSLTLLFPNKDGSASRDTFSGNEQDLTVDEKTQSVGWVSYKRYLLDFGNVKSAILMLHVKSVEGKGVCGIFSLMTRVEPAENRVRLSALRYDDMPIAAMPLDSGMQDQIIPLDITGLLKAKSFNGIAIRPMNGLSAKFSSKEGRLPPAIVIVKGRTGPARVRWFSGSSAPDSATGNHGDCCVCTANNVIYRKSSMKWDSVAVIAMPVAIKKVKRIK